MAEAQNFSKQEEPASSTCDFVIYSHQAKSEANPQKNTSAQNTARGSLRSAACQREQKKGLLSPALVKEGHLSIENATKDQGTFLDATDHKPHLASDGSQLFNENPLAGSEEILEPITRSCKRKSSRGASRSGSGDRQRQRSAKNGQGEQIFKPIRPKQLFVDPTIDSSLQHVSSQRSAFSGMQLSGAVLNKDISRKQLSSDRNAAAIAGSTVYSPKSHLSSAEQTVSGSGTFNPLRNSHHGAGSIYPLNKGKTIFHLTRNALNRKTARQNTPHAQALSPRRQPPLVQTHSGPPLFVTKEIRSCQPSASPYIAYQRSQQRLKALEQKKQTRTRNQKIMNRTHGPFQKGSHPPSSPVSNMSQDLHLQSANFTHFGSMASQGPECQSFPDKSNKSPRTSVVNINSMTHSQLPSRSNSRLEDFIKLGEHLVPPSAALLIPQMLVQTHIQGAIMGGFQVPSRGNSQLGNASFAKHSAEFNLAPHAMQGPTPSLHGSSTQKQLPRKQRLVSAKQVRSPTAALHRKKTSTSKGLSQNEISVPNLASRTSKHRKSMPEAVPCHVNLETHSFLNRNDLQQVHDKDASHSFSGPQGRAQKRSNEFTQFNGRGSHAVSPEEQPVLYQFEGENKDGGSEKVIVRVKTSPRKRDEKRSFELSQTESGDFRFSRKPSVSTAHPSRAHQWLGRRKKLDMRVNSLSSQSNCTFRDMVLIGAEIEKKGRDTSKDSQGRLAPAPAAATAHPQPMDESPVVLSGPEDQQVGSGSDETMSPATRQSFSFWFKQQAHSSKNFLRKKGLNQRQKRIEQTALMRRALNTHDRQRKFEHQKNLVQKQLQICLEKEHAFLLSMQASMPQVKDYTNKESQSQPDTANASLRVITEDNGSSVIVPQPLICQRSSTGGFKRSTQNLSEANYPSLIMNEPSESTTHHHKIQIIKPPGVELKKISNNLRQGRLEMEKQALAMAHARNEQVYASSKTLLIQSQKNINRLILQQSIDTTSDLRLSASGKEPTVVPLSKTVSANQHVNMLRAASFRRRKRQQSAKIHDKQRFLLSYANESSEMIPVGDQAELVTPNRVSEVPAGLDEGLGEVATSPKTVYGVHADHQHSASIQHIDDHKEVTIFEESMDMIKINKEAKRSYKQSVTQVSIPISNSILQHQVSADVDLCQDNSPARGSKKQLMSSTFVDSSMMDSKYVICGGHHKTSSGQHPLKPLSLAKSQVQRVNSSNQAQAQGVKRHLQRLNQQQQMAHSRQAPQFPNDLCALSAKAMNINIPAKALGARVGHTSSSGVGLRFPQNANLAATSQIDQINKLLLPSKLQDTTDMPLSAKPKRDQTIDEAIPSPAKPLRTERSSNHAAAENQPVITPLSLVEVSIKKNVNSQGRFPRPPSKPKQQRLMIASKSNSSKSFGLVSLGSQHQLRESLNSKRKKPRKVVAGTSVTTPLQGKQISLDIISTSRDKHKAKNRDDTAKRGAEMHYDTLLAIGESSPIAQPPSPKKTARQLEMFSENKLGQPSTTGAVARASNNVSIASYPDSPLIASSRVVLDARMKHTPMNNLNLQQANMAVIDVHKNKSDNNVIAGQDLTPMAERDFELAGNSPTSLYKQRRSNRKSVTKFSQPGQQIDVQRLEILGKRPDKMVD